VLTRRSACPRGAFGDPRADTVCRVEATTRKRTPSGSETVAANCGTIPTANNTDRSARKSVAPRICDPDPVSALVLPCSQDEAGVLRPACWRGWRDSVREQSDSGSEQIRSTPLPSLEGTSASPNRVRQQDHGYLRGIHVAADSPSDCSAPGKAATYMGGPNQTSFWASATASRC